MKLARFLIFLCISILFFSIHPQSQTINAFAQSDDCYWELIEEVPLTFTSSTAEGAVARIEGTNLYVSYQGLYTTHTWTALPEKLVPGNDVSIEISVSWDFDKSSPYDPVGGLKTSLVYDYTQRLEAGNSRVVFRTTPKDYLFQTLNYHVPSGSIDQEMNFLFSGDAAIGGGSYRYLYIFVCPVTIKPIELQYGVWAVSNMSGFVEAYYPVGKDKDGNFVYNFDEPHLVKEMMDLPVGTKVITSDNENSTVTVKDNVTNSVLILRPDTEVDLLGGLPEEPGVLKVLWGKLKMNVGKVLRGESIEVKTNLATLGIKGTEFIVEVDSEKTSLKVTEGVVSITSVDGKSTVINPGETAYVDINGLSAISTFAIQEELTTWQEFDNPLSPESVTEDQTKENNPEPEETKDEEDTPPSLSTHAKLASLLDIFIIVLGITSLIIILIVIIIRKNTKKKQME